MPPEYPIYPAGGEEFLWNLNGPGVSDSEAQDRDSVSRSRPNATVCQ